MRALIRTFSFALVATLLVLVAACGGDGDNGAVELPPAGEYQFSVEATMEIELSEELVSAAPLALQQPQTVDLSGTATIDIGPNGVTFNIPEFGISGTITIHGEDSPIQITENPDVPSTGEFTPDDTFFDLFFEVELANADTIVVRNEDPVHLEAGGPLVLDNPPLIIPPLILMTPDDLGPFPFTDPAPYDDRFVIRSMDLTLEPLDPPDDDDSDVDRAPAGDYVDVDDDTVDVVRLSAEEEAFQAVVGPFGMTPEQFFQLRGPSDPVQDLIYSISGVPPMFTAPQADIVLVFAGIFDLTQQASHTAFGNTAFPCDSLVDGTRTVCSADAGAVPPGEVVTLAMVLDGDVPMEDPDHFYTYSAVFDADGDPANNFQFVEPFNWDFFQNTDLWYQLDWDPTVGQWQLFVSSFVDQIPQDVASNARVVIDGNVIVFFIPVDEFGVARPDYRLTAFGHDGTFAPEASGGDVTGADPTEPLLKLPAEAIVIE